MEILLQQNKIILQGQKAQLVIKILFVLSILFLLGCKTKTLGIEAQYNDNDYVIAYKLLENIRDKNKDKVVVLNPSNNNEYPIGIIKKFKECESLQNKIECNELKHDLGNFDESYYQSIFNNKEYDDLISQKEESTWDIKKIRMIDKVLFEQNKVSNNKLEVFISKPIYTTDKKFALIYVNQTTRDYIDVYMRNTDNKWVEYKLIFPRLLTPLVQLKQN